MICSKFANEQDWTYFKNCILVRHYSCRHLENKICQTSRPLSPSRLPLRAHFHRERDVWVRGSRSSMRCERRTRAQTRGEGANLSTAMVLFCVIMSAPFHLQAHFWVPHLNFLALLGVGFSKDTLPGPKRLTKQGHPKTVSVKCFFFFGEENID